MKALRVAVITCHKFPGEDWAQGEFVEPELSLANGEEATRALAE